MRSGGGYAVQQALGAEAAAAMREAANLARRRGDARVTPLHIASAMLSGPAGLLRAACVLSSHWPLQHEALELRLCAALGRLPMAWPTAAAMSFHHHAPPPLAPSNALVAALKRATSARQRQQPASLGAVKDVEIEQLVISILDDPSVDRAMREAGFSSSQVKANVEKINVTASLEQSAGSGTTSPNTIRVYKKARAGGQPSHGETDLGLMHRPAVVDPERSLSLSLMSYYSGDPANQAKQRPRRPEPDHLVGSTEVVTSATASLPTWLRRCQDPTFLARSPVPISTSFCTQAAATCHRPKFTELTAENLKIMSTALELRLRHRRRHRAPDIAARIATAVLRCRSGMRRRRRSPATTSCWLLFQGEDVNAKKAVAEELASLVFGSGAELASFTLADHSAIATNSGYFLKRKRSRDDGGDGYDVVVGVRKLLFEAIAENPHRVVWIDGAEQLDHESEIAIRNVIVQGRIAGCDDDGRVVSLQDAFVVLSSNDQCRREGDRSRSMEKAAKSRRFNFDLNTCQEEEEDSPDDFGIMNAVDGVFSFDLDENSPRARAR